MRLLSLAFAVALCSCLAPPMVSVDVHLSGPPRAAAADVHPLESAAPAFQVACNGSVKRIEASAGQSYTDIFIWNGTNSGGSNSTAVFLGDGTATTTLGMPICNTSSCSSTGAELPVRGAFCITAGSPVTVTAQVLQ